MIDLARTTAVVQRVLPAMPDEVFNEWIDPDALADWMCPRPARATKIWIDARVGGKLSSRYAQTLRPKPAKKSSK